MSASLTIVRAVNDARNIIANANAPQISDFTTLVQRVLGNDLPATGTTRTAVLLSAPVRTGGSGAGTLALSCATLGTAGTAVGGNTICTNGAFRVTLTGVGANAAALTASKRGTWRFTYQMNLNGQLSNTATVTIRVF